jgi:hypothetical protein
MRGEGSRKNEKRLRNTHKLDVDNTEWLEFKRQTTKTIKREFAVPCDARKTKAKSVDSLKKRGETSNKFVGITITENIHFGAKNISHKAQQVPFVFDDDLGANVHLRTSKL